MEGKVYDLITIKSKDFVQMVGSLPFSAKQLNLLMQKTPPKFIKKRPIPGGGEAEFVETHYVIGMLNLVTGYQWDFDVIEEKEAHGQVIIRGKLTIHARNNKTLSKTQYGRAPIKYKTTMMNGKKVPTDKTVDFGNDFKAATSDAIKKCASLFGIAWDVYGKEDMREMQLVDTQVKMQNKEEVLEVLDPIDAVIARVTAKLDTLSSVDRLKAIKVTRKMNIKSFTEADWRRLDSDLGTEKQEGGEDEGNGHSVTEDETGTQAQIGI